MPGYTKKVSFKPAEYGVPVSSSHSSHDGLNVSKDIDQEVSKGKSDVIKLDVNKLNNLAEELRPYADTPYRGLSGELDKKFRELVYYVSVLYDTPSYHILYDIVTKYFGDLTEVIPGTIGAYCIGCSRGVKGSSEYENIGCTSICAGSMPPKEDGWSVCPDPVILASYSDNVFTFSLLKKGSHGDVTVVYIFVNYDTIEVFPGFTDSEKTALKDMGFLEAYLCGYSKNGKDYIELISGAVRIDNIKSRSNTHNNQNDTNDTILVILLVIVILIGLFFAWRYWQGNFKRTSM